MLTNPKQSQKPSDGLRTIECLPLRFGVVLAAVSLVLEPVAAASPKTVRATAGGVVPVSTIAVRPTLATQRPVAPAATWQSAAATGRSAPPAVVKQQAAHAPDSAELQRRHEAALRHQQDHLPLPIFVKLMVPEEWRVTLYAAGGVPHTYDKPIVAGMRARHRYAIALAHGPKESENRYYGTIEVLRGPRLPEGMKGSDVPVPVRFTFADVSAIARANMLTKIVVLEDPNEALSGPSKADEPIRYEATAHDDPIDMAKQLGRLVLVVRIGTRVPTESELAGITVARSLLVPRQVPVTDATGQERVAEYFIYADEAMAPVARAAESIAERYSQPPVLQTGWFHRPKPHRRGPTPDCVAGIPEATIPHGAAPIGLPEPLLPLDEYVTDGGDRGLKAGVSPLRHVINVDPGDTVADWTDRKNVRRFTPSNEVAVYAPRFVEVRFVQGIDGFHGRLISHRLDHDQARDEFVQRQAEVTTKQVERPSATRSRIRASGLANEQWAGSFSEIMTIEGFERRLGWAQTIEAHGPESVAAADQAFLAAQTAFARTMSREQFPQAVGMAAGVGQLIAIWQQRTVYIVEEQPGKPSRLAITKRASVTHANIGDAVEFVIEYKNTGEETIRNIAIIDSLIARLEYVQGSADSNRDAIFTAQENEVGSHTLRWEIKEPLKGGQTGVVRFQARVR